MDSGRHSTLAVVQAYLSDPYLLPGGRKFDMRVWVLIDPAFRVYAHRLGVCRTSSVPYVRDDLSNKLSHITNHCIQEGAEHFGEHEPVRPWLASCSAPMDTWPVRPVSPAELSSPILHCLPLRLSGDTETHTDMVRSCSRICASPCTPPALAHGTRLGRARAACAMSDQYILSTLYT